MSHELDLSVSKVNAVACCVEHVRSMKSGDRIDSAWFGSGAALKERALARALEFVGNERAAK